MIAFTLDGTSSKIIAGNHGNLYAGDGGPAIYASLYNPGALALANGILFINVKPEARASAGELCSGYFDAGATGAIVHGR